MKIVKDGMFHVYNRGNQQQKIFFRPENYDYFLGKVKSHIAPVCDVLEYCLMPNHFHFIIKAFFDRYCGQRKIKAKETRGKFVLILHLT